MFENIIAQPVTDQLQTDILSNRLAPSLLFFGPQASGKGSSALELARALSCEKTNSGNSAAAGNCNTAPWNCDCSSCARHRSLTHPDFAMIGPRSFAAEIAASGAVFLKDTSSVPGRMLFIRSLRKLLARFAPAVWEYESRSGKINPLPLIQSLEEELDEIETLAGSEKHAVLEKHAMLDKLAASLVKNASKLEDEWISESIPIAQVRKVSFWSRLSPAGKRKILIIENADRMQEPAANTLLKLLEEPPGSIAIVLTAQRRESLLPTIQSRLRPYRFITRSAEQEREIIRRVFRDTHHTAESVSAYLDSFLPQPSDKLTDLSAFFIAAVTRAIAGKTLAAAITALDSYCTSIADKAGFNRATEAKEVIAILLSSSGNFEARSFPRFLALSLGLVSRSFAECSPNPALVTCREIWNKRIGEAQAAFGVWNQKPDLILESLYYRLKEDMAA